MSAVVHACMQVWLTAYTNMGAGILFFLAGAFYAMDAVSIWLLPGAVEAVEACEMLLYILL